MKQERIKQLIVEGQRLLQTATPVDYPYLAHLNQINETDFNNWNRQVRDFILGNNYGKKYIAREPRGMNRSNFNTTEDQLELLNDLLTEILEN